ncbi:MAG: PAS domain-containing protein [Drouetiella hepatica Uher 2000/2452]|jgi:PAS domain S-box-containing protein|uniref:histidine kinase n=1 Tax=Drouetiella hepatica Uher 2000/2452 TaxID=904376 RepID=A0A951UQR3_9CYAN|nr:PAS domain-containing protein [Drouetiella hepatica Uher 2000/2452]
MDLKLKGIPEEQALTYLRFVIDHVLPATCLYDAQGNVLHANEKFVVLVQRSRSDLTFLAYFSAWIPGKTLEALWGAALRGDPATFVLQTPLMPHPVSCSLHSPIPGGVVMLKVDTEYKTPQIAQNSLAANLEPNFELNLEPNFAQLFNTPSLAIALMNCKGQGFRFNDRFRQTFCSSNDSSDDVSPLSLDNLVHPEDQDLDTDLRQRLIAGELPHYTIEQRFIAANQDVIWMNKTVLLTPAPSSRIGSNLTSDSQSSDSQSSDSQYLTVLLEDITETKKVYHALAWSEGKWHEFVSTSSNLYLECGLAGQIVYASSMINPILGYSADEVLDSYLSDFIHPEDLNHFDQALRSWTNRLETGRPGIECRWQHKTGEWIYLYLQGKRFAPSVESSTLLIQAYNVTDRRILEEELTRFKVLALNIPGATFRCSADYCMGYLSHKIEEITGYPATDFINDRVRSYLSIVYPPDRQKLLSKIRMRAGSYSVEYRIVRANGSLRQVCERGQRTFDRNGNLLWMDGIIWDSDRQPNNQHGSLQGSTSKNIMQSLPNRASESINLNEEHIMQNSLPHLKAAYTSRNSSSWESH